MTDADSAVPPRLDEDAISKLELTEVADLIRTRQLTSAEVTESTLRRIERLDPQLKSYAFVMPETALAAARAADADIARGHYEGPARRTDRREGSLLHGRRPDRGRHHHLS